MTRIVVVGGGIAGLAAAHRAVELGREREIPIRVSLLEASDRLGGAIRTVRRDGMVLELGPESFITDKPWGLSLAKRVGLEPEIVGTNAAMRRSFVVRHRRLYPVPEGFQILAPSRLGPLATTPLFTPAGKLRMALEPWVPARRQPGDESLGSFISRRMGREALERLAEPMIAGIYGSDPWELSIDATLPRFREMEVKHGSVLRGMWARMRQTAGERGGVSGARYGLFISFRNGMESLIEALAAALPEGTVQTGAEVVSLRRLGNEWEVKTRGGLQTADLLVIALPAGPASHLLRTVAPDLSAGLSRINYRGAGTANLIFRRDQVKHPLNGFGFVVPTREGLSILGCTFTNVKWPGRAPEEVAALRVFFGDRVVQAADHPELIARAKQDLGELLGVVGEPLHTECWSARQVMPHYAVGHLNRVADLEAAAARLPGLAVAGNAYRGVGIPDTIHVAETAVEGLFERLPATSGVA